MRKIHVLTIIALSTVLSAQISNACTSILATPGATQDGSMLVAHADDNDLSDQRFMYVPASNHTAGSKRPVYAYHLDYPRYVGNERGDDYARLKGYPKTKPLGYIPQVKHTYAYIDASYAVMNEYQLSIAESTTESKVSLDPDAHKRLLDIAALSHIALERCKTARCAIQLMGPLAEKYGYYGEGETLLIGDKKEGWLFEISGTPTGQSALWVAKKIPNGTVAVVANEYRIREVSSKDPNMMHSKNLFSLTKKYGWWKNSNDTFDWLKVVSHGEYFHPYYSLRRVWRIYSILNPTLHLSPWVKDGFTKAYPFSIKPEHKINAHTVMNLFRDHYQGTPFDLTKGLAAGPFGSPERYFGPNDENEALYFHLKKSTKIPGAWERPISVHYCGFVTICQIRPQLPDLIGGIVWVGLDRPYTTVFVPFYIGINHMPISYSTGSPDKFDRKTAWWAYDFVGNWVNLKYNYMIKDITKKQSQLENEEFTLLSKIDRRALTLYKIHSKLARKYLTSVSAKNATHILHEWWKLADRLIVKYAQGFVGHKNVGYPEHWLKAVGYYQGPVTYAPYK